jgi:hypothetical protein
MTYRVWLSNQALGTFERIIEAPSAAEAIIALARIGLGPCRHTTFDAALLNYRTTFGAEPLTKPPIDPDA